ASFPLPFSLCGASVEFNGDPAPLYNASPTQVSAQIPTSVVAGSPLQVVASRDHIRSAAASIPKELNTASAPALYSYSLDDKQPRAFVVHADQSMNGPPASGKRPIRPGEAATLFANSLGPTLPAVPDGHSAPDDPPALLATPVEVYVNGESQPILFAGLAPTLSGFYQINFNLTASTPIKEENANVIWIRVLDAESPRLLLSLAGN
ncbi:MAG: hypothetical protein ACRD96_14755, partial [Bryobacteraceae bacterium]